MVKCARALRGTNCRPSPSMNLQERTALHTYARIQCKALEHDHTPCQQHSPASRFLRQLPSKLATLQSEIVVKDFQIVTVKLPPFAWGYARHHLSTLTIWSCDTWYSLQSRGLTTYTQATNTMPNLCSFWQIQRDNFDDLGGVWFIEDDTIWSWKPISMCNWLIPASQLAIHTLKVVLGPKTSWSVLWCRRGCQTLWCDCRAMPRMWAWRSARPSS